MKRLYLLFILMFPLNSAFSQSGTWTWISGSKVVNAKGVYGTQGTGAVANHPPAIYEPVSWKAKNGAFWLYGGTDSTYCDLWKFDPVSLKWTWVKGNKLANQATVYGTQGMAAASNTPGVRSYTAATWVDTSGGLWLMGGNGQYDDLWRYDTLTNMWTWMKGTKTNQYSVHGAQGVASGSITPGNRDGTCSAWTDKSNNLWLYGGFGYEDDGQGGSLEDVWKFNIATKNWAWMKGSQYVNTQPVYGTKAVDAPSNSPGSRFTYDAWKDTSGNFWILGGLDWTNFNIRNDVWKFNPTTNNWTWMTGPQALGDEGTYPTACSYTTIGTPNSRWYSRSAVTDNCGKFWQFGGFGVESNLNDLWVFDPAVIKWNLVKGPGPAQTGVYGAKGTGALANMPPARGGAVAWWGNNNRFYVFGGQGNAQSTIYADMWMFTPDTVSCVPTCSGASLPAPEASFTASKVTLCASDSTDFTDLSTNASEWIWNFTGGTDSTSSIENPQNIRYLTAGTYNVTLIAYNAAGITDTSTVAAYIDVEYAPQPVILNTNDTLYFHPNTSYVSYQWYKNAVTIPFATDTLYYIGIDSSTYSVIVQTAHHCSNSAEYSLRPLPIELLDFSAAYNAELTEVDLKWSTASEINNDFFTVEKSKDEVHFTPVAEVKGAGTSKSLLNYSIVDEHPFPGVSYYRLKQTDFDGHYSYSNIVAVKSSGENSDYNLFPNPTGNTLLVYSAQSEFTVTNATIYNVIGEVILSNTLFFEEGRGEVIDVSALPAGIYFLQLQSESDSAVKRFVKE